MRTRLFSLLGAITLVAMLPGCAFISRATETETGTQADSYSGFASLSDNGRWVAFRSFATNLVPDDTNGVYDVFVRDNQTKRVVRVSIATDGTQGNGTSEWPSISNDGSRIAFASVASNLIPGDTNGVRDIFIHDRDTDDDGVFDEPENVFTERLSGTLGGGLGNAPSDRPAIFGDGNGVVYESAAALVPEDTNVDLDVYMTLFGGFIPITRLVSDPVHVSNPANGTSFSVSVNVDGSVIAFTTLATNMFAGDTNGVSDVVVARGVSLGLPITLERVTGAIQGDSSSSDPAVSDEGGFVAFDSWATNLVPGDTGQQVDVFVADLDTHGITVESRRPDGTSANSYSVNASISADGSRVSFSSLASDLVPGDTNAQEDIFVRDRMSGVTQIASTTLFLDPANGFSGRSALSDDGRYVAFDSTATNLVTPDANGSAPDIFTRASVVPQIDSVARVGSLTFGGKFEAAPRLGWGRHTLRITGKGFGPDVSVALGAGVTILSVQRTPTQINVELSVANGSSGTRDVTVSNVGLLPINSIASSQVCAACVAIQRWVTVPDPVPSNDWLVRVLSNNEFTPATNWPGIDSFFITASELWLHSETFFQSLPTGSHDMTLAQTVNGTVTCTGCLHAP